MRPALKVPLIFAADLRNIRRRAREISAPALLIICKRFYFKAAEMLGGFSYFFFSLVLYFKGDTPVILLKSFIKFGIEV